MVVAEVTLCYVRGRDPSQFVITCDEFQSIECGRRIIASSR
jgi:hypothetical protein